MCLFISCFFCWFVFPDVPLWDNEITERQKSHKILEELLNQGIIPKEQHREKSSRVGEAYSIMVSTWCAQNGTTLQASYLTALLQMELYF